MGTQVRLLSLPCRPRRDNCFCVFRLCERAPMWPTPCLSLYLSLFSLFGGVPLSTWCRGCGEEFSRLPNFFFFLLVPCSVLHGSLLFLVPDLRCSLLAAGRSQSKQAKK